MAQEQNLNLDLRLGMRLSVQQLRFVKLLEYNTPELEDAVERELADNPALEAVEEPASPKDDVPSYRLKSVNSSADDYGDYDFSPADSGESLYDSILRQLSERDLSPNVDAAARFIAGSLDPNGYLRRPLRSLVDDMAFGPGLEVSDAEAHEALEAIRSLEPYGIGASGLQDSLEIQLRHLSPSQERDDALLIVGSQFEALSMKHTKRIVSALQIPEQRIRKAIDLILTLNPKPGAAVGSGSDASAPIIPDLVVDNDGGRLSISLNNRIPELQVNRSFSEAMAELDRAAEKRKARKGQEFVITRYNDARDFIKILSQRQETLITVMAAIMKIQEEYFHTEDVYRLKPMIIKDISAITGLDISVVSRATNNKYVSTPWGVFPLRFFFSDAVGEGSGEDDDTTALLTNRKIEAEIEAIVGGENKQRPLSDEKIRALMLERGYDISRRTIAKYRDRKGIPVARLRKQL